MGRGSFFETMFLFLGALIILRLWKWVNFTEKINIIFLIWPLGNFGKLCFCTSTGYIWRMKILWGPQGLGTPGSTLGTLIILKFRKWGSTKSPNFWLGLLAVSTVDKQAREVTWKKRKTMTIVCIKSNFVCRVSSLICLFSLDCYKSHNWIDYKQSLKLWYSLEIEV